MGSQVIFSSTTCSLFIILYFSESSSNSQSDVLLRAAVILIFALQKILPSLQQIYGSNAFIKNNIQKVSVVNSLAGSYLPEVSRVDALQIASTKSINNFDRLCFSNVSYVYPDDSVVFEPFSLSILMGDKILLTGKSGSGKSTFCDLLMGFIPPTGGLISLDETEISDLAIQKKWQSSISFAPQASPILQANLCYNVCLSSLEDCDYERFKLVCAIADISDLFRSYENSPYQSFSENGSNLSGGQKQRIIRRLSRCLKIMYGYIVYLNSIKTIMKSSSSSS